MRKKLSTFFIISIPASVTYAQDSAIPIEAEDADSIGSDFNVVTEGDITCITPSTNYAATTNPGSSDKIAEYVVTFAAAGTYDLYVKLRVGADGYDDCPGTSEPFIAKFERNNVHSASISWWFTGLPGRLGSLLTSSNKKGSGCCNWIEVGNWLIIKR